MTSQFKIKNQKKILPDRSNNFRVELDMNGVTRCSSLQDQRTECQVRGGSFPESSDSKGVSQDTIPRHFSGVLFASLLPYFASTFPELQVASHSQDTFWT